LAADFPQFLEFAGAEERTPSQFGGRLGLPGPGACGLLSVEAIGLDLFFGCHGDFERAKPIWMARVFLLLTESYCGRGRELAGISGKLFVWQAKVICVARD
jgi:hypothetical protein